MRLDKFLCHAGLGTRSEVKNILKNKEIAINDQIVISPSIIIDENTDIIKYNGEIIEYHEFRYYILYKPKGYLSATEDERLPVVMDLLDEPYRNLSPVGRLDLDTTGLLLITNNGKLNHFLLSPNTHVDKEYYVTVDKPLKTDLKEKFLDGVMLDDGYKCLPSHFAYVDEYHANVVLHEGKYHQVKRMFQAFGYTVIDLHRNRMDFLTLDGLHENEYRELTKEEIIRLLKHVK